MTERCETCRYWRYIGETECTLTYQWLKRGWCKRYPEAVGRLEDDWCGEWRAREPEPEREP